MPAQARHHGEQVGQRGWLGRWLAVLSDQVHRAPLGVLEDRIAGQLRALPPQAHQVQHAPGTAVLAEEQHPPAGTEPLRWLLLTSLAVETREQVLEVINYYLARWEIELFFRVLKGGCQVEALQLEALSRLEPALALYMIEIKLGGTGYDFSRYSPW